MKRRTFLKSTALIGASTLILPRTKLFGADAPSNKLNIALIGAAGRGSAHYGVLKNENVVALCDVNEEHFAKPAKLFPNAKTYVDWRRCLDQKDINAVLIATPDHTHAFIANWAINRGYHVYCEKPIANCVEEARVVRANYLKNKGKIATQVGTQRHEHENFERIREMILDGAIGELESVCAWGNRQIPKPGYLPAAGDPPSSLHYDLWIGPSPMHPYNPGYFGGCLKWNMYWDFGSGQVGDMGSHTMDLAWNSLDATLPTTAEAKGDPVNPEVTPVKLEMHWDLPANNWRKAIKCSWFQGGAMPANPIKYVDLNQIDHGAMFEGSKGTIVADFTTRMLLPNRRGSDMTSYKVRSQDAVRPSMGGFQAQWINAAKGDLKTDCNFEYAGNMIEMMLLGLVAYRVGKKISYDGVNGRVTDNEQANALLKREYRDGWTLNG